MKTMQIFDSTSNKIREISNPKIVYYTMSDKYGKNQDVKGVQFMIIGKNRRWEQWIPYDEFTEKNPNVNILEEEK